MKCRFNKVVLIIAFFCFLFGWSQTNIPPNIIAVGDQYYCPLSQINIVTSFNIIDPDDTEIDVLHIQISTGYQTGQDQLILNGSHPNITSTWNISEGKLTLNGVSGAQMLYTDLIAAVLDVVFQSSATSVSNEKFFSFNIGDANYLPLTDHYYEYISNSGVTWTEARDLAATYTYFGLQGYLATLLYPEEAQLTGEQAASTGWIGGSDQETEGVWKWVTGPEAGLIFWNGLGNGSTPNYANWDVNEPNQFGDEDYAHITDCTNCQDGSWNDLPNEGSDGEYYPRGFVVEYGGMPGDPDVNISASTKIMTPSIVSVSGDSRCGDGSVSLQATSDSGTVIWFDALTAGNQLATGNTFITPSINTTTTFYALTSVNGCLEGVRVPVVATIYDIPTIDSITEDIVCIGDTAQLFATATNGAIVRWYEAAVGGPIIGNGGAFSTPVLNTTTTYYIDADTSNGCATLSRTPITAIIQQVATPIGNALQTFCDIENATIADLIVTGIDVIWYDANIDGNVLSNTDILTSATYYATQTLQDCESPVRLVIDVIIYETVVPLQQSEIPNILSCDDLVDGNDTNGFVTFDLTQNESILLNGKSDSGFQSKYFTDALYSNQIMNPSAFVNTIQDGQAIYVRMANIFSNNCYTDLMFIIQVDALPVIQSSIVFKNCDEDGIPDGFTDYNLTEANDVITDGNADELTIRYYLSAAEAESGIGAIEPVPFNNATASTVYARVENNEGCYRVSTVNLQVSTTSFPLGYLQELENCDDDNTIDGLHKFDLTQASPEFIAEFPTGQNLSVHYYKNIEDAQFEANEILPQENYINDTPFSQTLYVRVESEDNGDCYGIGPHLLLTIHPRPEFEVDQSEIYCLNDEPITLITFNSNGNFLYEWTDASGVVVSNLPTATVLVGGTYTVIATSSFDCESFPVSFAVIESSIADISNDDITIVQLSDNNSIRINDNNLGIGDYEYALDDISGPYQDDPYFDQVGAGVHTLYVQDKNGCGIADLEVFVMGFPKFLTPNNDGYNDTWNVKGLGNEYSQNSTVYIYDRYGKLIKQINPRAEGWNGTFNGQNLKASDYWFVVQLENINGNATTYRGHFSLVR